MLSLKSFHLFFIALSIIVMAGFGTWGVLNDHRVLGSLSLTLGGLLTVYEAYFAYKADRLHLE